jgi:carboxylesterase type B
LFIIVIYFSNKILGLFSRGVSMSGTALCRWAIAENVQEKSQQIAAALGCGMGSSKEKLDCMKSRPAQNIVALVEQMQVNYY